jgi:hypothetical protein
MPAGAGPSCSQSFLSKDLWFPGRNFLFREFSFKRSVVSGPEFPIPKVFFQKICGFRARRSGRPGWRTVYRGPKTQVTFKTVPRVSMGPKTIQDLNHTFLFLYLPSPES